LPIAALDPDGDTAAGLRRAGLRSIGDLAARPMAGLAARFGEGLVASLRAVLGEVASPQAPLNRPAPIRAAARFPEPIARTADVIEVIESLIAQAAAQMAARDLGGCRFAIRLERSDHVKRDLVIDTSLPLRDPAAVMRLLRERIETLADPLDPGFGFDAVLLSVPRTAPCAQQTAMEGPAHSENTIAALIDRLSTRLGPDCVLRLHPRDTHIPENTQALRPAQHRGASPWPQPPAHPRPISLLTPPQPITAIAGVPDGPPCASAGATRRMRSPAPKGPSASRRNGGTILWAICPDTAR
jgi:protein ImuB